MRHGKLIALAATLAAIPANVLAEPPSAPTMGTVTMDAPSSMHGAMPRPHGWVWGRPGWWGGSYQPPIRGYILPSYWLGSGYVVPDWAGYGFAEPGRGRRWVRYYDDAVLVDDRGMIYDSVSDVTWGRHSRGPVPIYVGGASDASPPYGAGYGYDDDEVTWRGGSSRSDRRVWAWPDQTASAHGNTVIMVPPGATTTIMIQPQQVTTTTVTYQDVTPAWKASPRAKVKYRSSAPPRVIGRVPVKKG